MKYLTVLATASLSTVKVSFQSLIAKRGESGVADKVLFTSLIFFVSALFFCPYLFYADNVVWQFAAIYALCNVLFQISYICALSKGNVSLAVMFANFGMLLPILTSLILYGEKPSRLRILGIALMACAFIFTVKREGERKRGYLALVTLSMLANGLGLSVQRVYARTVTEGSVFSFVSASYLISAVISFAVFLALNATGHKKSRTVNRRDLLYSVGAGASLASFLALNTYAATFLDSSFQYPAHSGTAILLSTLCGVIFFKDKLTARQTVACVLGLGAIVLMSF